MFENIGGKIKGMAQVFFVLGMHVCFFFSFMFLKGTGTLSLSRVAISLIGAVCVWCLSLLLYGYGEIVETSGKAAKILEEKCAE